MIEVIEVNGSALMWLSDQYFDKLAPRIATDFVLVASSFLQACLQSFLQALLQALLQAFFLAFLLAFVRRPPRQTR